jgi:hypothetical protein
MCFNETASLFAFSVGSIFTGILVGMHELYYALLMFSIIIMQLYEYIAHYSIRTKNNALNTLATKLIYIGIISQPLFCFLGKYLYIPLPSYYYWLLCSYIIICIFVFLQFDKEHIFTTKYLNDECISICRLVWFTEKKNILPYTLLVFISYSIMMLTIFIPDPRIPPIFNYIFYGLLLFSIVYVLFIPNINIHKIISMSGSIWCFLSVFAGPLFVYFLR